MFASLPCVVWLFTLAGPNDTPAVIVSDRGLTQAVAPPHGQLADAARPSAAKHSTIFVNFGGAELTTTDDFTHDDARRDTSWLFGGTFERYDHPESEAAIIQAVRQDFAAYDIDVVDRRPDDGAYVMALVTPTNPMGGKIIGYAPVDCWDAASPSNIIFAFHDPHDGYSTIARATTVSQEVAHSFGLEHTNAPSDVMNPIVGNGVDPSFGDACHPTTGETFCVEQHAARCGSQGQNAHQELLVMFGPSAPDTTPPTGSIHSPADGATVDGTSMTVVVQADDDTAVRSVVLFDGGTLVSQQRAAPYRWRIQDPARGTHELYALVIDQAGLETLTEVTLVGVGEPPADHASADLPGLPGGPPLEYGEEPDGCAIARTQHPAAATVVLCVLGLLGTRRRVTGLC